MSSVNAFLQVTKLEIRRIIRSYRFLVLLLVCLGLGATTAEAQKKKEKSFQEKPFQEKIDKAVERGARWLLKKRGRKADYGPLPREGALHEYGFPSGLTALAYYTLVTAGKKPETSALKALYRRLKRRHARPVTTYETAVLLMAIDSRYSETATRSLP